MSWLAVRERVYRCIVAADAGCTCDEVEQLLGLPHQTVSARIRELVQGGRVEYGDRYRPTRTGVLARVYYDCGGLPLPAQVALFHA